ncbi:uncharacterized protein LAESUDRAFT_356401 [Laetiporus sulphureus 93-53]|uniref:Uncharacterized protein n=1 Tax=Laetiporus sulphureus 93-53 TaxID=1314785 RepID=A0A165GWT3_9APHY|nr:uncharacterized protein LAESUDRAFT_356401 [Laetiporus sulphureus 93-53]KZT10934.1 hypothetical protein LAESUDRAFT_356401 [Laetiporus sulphureus 93-53]
MHPVVALSLAALRRTIRSFGTLTPDDDDDTPIFPILRYLEPRSSSHTGRHCVRARLPAASLPASLCCAVRRQTGRLSLGPQVVHRVCVETLLSPSFFFRRDIALDVPSDWARLEVHSGATRTICCQSSHRNFDLGPSLPALRCTAGMDRSRRTMAPQRHTLSGDAIWLRYPTMLIHLPDGHCALQADVRGFPGEARRTQS